MIVRKIALIPEAVAKAAVPPSRAETRSSKTDCAKGLKYYSHFTRSLSLSFISAFNGLTVRLLLPNALGPASIRP